MTAPPKAFPRRRARPRRRGWAGSGPCRPRARPRCLARLAALAGLLAALGTLSAVPTLHAQDGPAGDRAAAVQRGEYIFRAAGGCGCHTDYAQDGAPLAGGRALATPFGTFYSTNITPHPGAGIGDWSDADFLRAMREGVGPQGTHYFPVFPYPSFAGMTERDLLDLKAYLFSRPPVPQANRTHDVWPPFGWRIAARAWQWLHHEPALFRPAPDRPDDWNRGAYLANAVAHCGECHTPRTLSGALDREHWYAGSVDGPEGELAPNITPHEATGIGEWTPPDLVWFLETGLKPDGDDAQGLMIQVIEHGYAELTRADREAIAAYVLSLPPIANEVRVPDARR